MWIWAIPVKDKTMESKEILSQKTKIINRLKRLEGQVRGLQKMVENNRSCTDTLTLLSGIRSALDATADVILEDYIQTCKGDLANDPEEMNEILKAIKLARG